MHLSLLLLSGLALRAAHAQVSTATVVATAVVAPLVTYITNEVTTYAVSSQVVYQPVTIASVVPVVQTIPLVVVTSPVATQVLYSVYTQVASVAPVVPVVAATTTLATVTVTSAGAAASTRASATSVVTVTSAAAAGYVFPDSLSLSPFLSTCAHTSADMPSQHLLRRRRRRHDHHARRRRKGHAHARHGARRWRRAAGLEPGARVQASPRQVYARSEGNRQDCMIHGIIEESLLGTQVRRRDSSGERCRADR